MKPVLNNLFSYRWRWPVLPRLIGNSWSAVAVSIVLVLNGWVWATAPTEYQLKAAFIFNFAKFVEWPAAAFRSSQSPITICVFGEDPFGRDLDEIVKGQTIGARSVAVRRITQAPRADTCQVLFVGAAVRNDLQELFLAVATQPVLTVCEDESLRSEGVIHFLLEENKVRFMINLDSAERAGIKISSKLLKLAKIVHNRGKN